MVIDSHLHFFDAPRPGSQFTHVRDHLSYDDIRTAAADVGIDRFVQVTPAAVGYDNGFSFAIAEAEPQTVFGVIARLDPADPQIEAQLRDAMRRPQMLALRLTLIEKHSESWLEDRKLDRFFEFAQDLGVPIELFAPLFPASKAMHADGPALSGHPVADRSHGPALLREQGQPGGIPAVGRPPRPGRSEPNAWIKCSYFPEAAKDIETYPYPAAQQHLRRLYERKWAPAGSCGDPIIRTCGAHARTGRRWTSSARVATT